ncbi:MAG TPA: hypothetical protein VL461_13440 [Dictyobacter sp.]|jgi:hypothetical protein|nr:hypothetical protein [Dictyobacter sp.]
MKMRTQSRISPNVLREKLLSQRKYSTEMLRDMIHRGWRLSSQHASPTEDQRQLVSTGFVLACASILMAFFPVCGWPVAISALLLGLYGRYKTSLRVLSSWTVVLSVIGLLLVCLNTIILLGVYI